MQSFYARVHSIYSALNAVPDELPFAAHIRDRHCASEYLKYGPVLAAHLSPNAKVLDWGAQYGHVSVLLDALKFEAIPFVVNPTPGVCAALEKEFHNRWVRGDDPVALPFTTGSLDAVVSSGVFEHVIEEGGSFEGSLREIHRVLREGGHFVLWKLPQAAALAELKSDLLGRWSHSFRFTPAGIRLMLERFGFEVVSMDYDGLLPGRACSALRRLRLSGLLGISERLARKWPFRVFSNDLTVVARARAQNSWRPLSEHIHGRSPYLEEGPCRANMSRSAPAVHGGE
jgi:SAM-dependent methyltransferase